LPGATIALATLFNSGEVHCIFAVLQSAAIAAEALTPRRG
jgi:hypothetical protein